MKVGGTAAKPRSIAKIIPRRLRIQHFVGFLLTISIIKLCTTDISSSNKATKNCSKDDGVALTSTAATSEEQLLLPPRQPPIFGGDSSTSTTTADNNIPVYQSAVKFVFFVGIEGTGHHTMESLIRQSPSTKYLEEIGIIPDKAIQLARSLWDAKSNDGFLNAHCDKSTSGGLQSLPTPLTLMKKNRGSFQKNRNNRMAEITNYTVRRGQQQRHRRLKLDNKRQQEVIINTPTGPDTQKLLNHVVHRLEEINTIVVSSSNKRRQQKNTASSSSNKKNDDDQPIIHMAINTWKDITNLGELSFPNGKTKCRILSYPNLDLLYEACQIANVDCGHVYIYRDPYNVIRSTARRNLHSTILEAIHLYTSYLYMIYGLLATNYFERTLGCWGVLEDSNNNKEITLPSPKQEKGVSWKDELKVMFQWNNVDDDEFQKVLEANYKAPISMTVQQKQDLVPASLRPYMQSMYKAHQNVIDLCRAQVSRQKLNT